MTIFGLNSPELFLLFVIILVILGTKRIEKGLDLFLRLLKFLLSNQSSFDKKDKNKESIQEIEVIQNKEDEKKKTKGMINAKEKELTKDLEDIQDKEDKKKKTKEMINVKEKELTKDVEDIQDNEDEKKKTKGMINAKEKELTKEVAETQEREYISAKRLKVTNKNNNEKKSSKTKKPKSILEDKNDMKSKTINFEEEQIEK